MCEKLIMHSHQINQVPSIHLTSHAYTAEPFIDSLAQYVNSNYGMNTYKPDPNVVDCQSPDHGPGFGQVCRFNADAMFGPCNIRKEFGYR